jgi:hypothetical protein
MTDAFVGISGLISLCAGLFLWLDYTEAKQIEDEGGPVNISTFSE